MLNDESIISFAIQRESRKRYRELLQNKKSRPKLLDKLNHNPPLDERFTTWHEGIDEAMQQVNLPKDSKVYIMSAAKELDQKHFKYSEIPFILQSSFWGGIVCLSKNQALYFGEGNEQAAYIHNPNHQPRAT